MNSYKHVQKVLGPCRLSAKEENNNANVLAYTVPPLKLEYSEVTSRRSDCPASHAL